MENRLFVAVRQVGPGVLNRVVAHRADCHLPFRCQGSSHEEERGEAEDRREERQEEELAAAHKSHSPDVTGVLSMKWTFVLSRAAANCVQHVAAPPTSPAIDMVTQRRPRWVLLPLSFRALVVVGLTWTFKCVCQARGTTHHI